MNGCSRATSSQIRPGILRPVRRPFPLYTERFKNRFINEKPAGRAGILAPVVLASASTARAAMLGAAGIAVRSVPAAVDEAALREALMADGAQPEDAATVLAEMKGRAVLPRLTADEEIVLASDQLLVTDDGRWLDKPLTRERGRSQLRDLAGKRHRLVVSAVGFRGGTRVWHEVSEARLWMRPLSETFIDDYLDRAGEAVLHSVGCYHLEGLGVQLMARVQGDWFTILGMPLLPVLQFLRDQRVLAD
ncbi:MAG: Maf-like protein [Geminicoccaceae bacterium]|nr:Maf-like protein [Geminicoccaceae bacterium]